MVIFSTGSCHFSGLVTTIILFIYHFKKLSNLDKKSIPQTFPERKNTPLSNRKSTLYADDKTSYRVEINFTDTENLKQPVTGYYGKSVVLVNFENTIIRNWFNRIIPGFYT